MINDEEVLKKHCALFHILRDIESIKQYEIETENVGIIQYRNYLYDDYKNFTEDFWYYSPLEGNRRSWKEYRKTKQWQKNTLPVSKNTLKRVRVKKGLLYSPEWTEYEEE